MAWPSRGKDNITQNLRWNILAKAPESRCSQAFGGKSKRKEKVEEVRERERVDRSGKVTLRTWALPPAEVGSRRSVPRGRASDVRSREVH